MTLAVATAVLLTTVACDTFSTFQRLGASIDDAGAVHIHYLACEYEEIAALRLIHSNDQLGEEDDELLWEIRPDAGGGGGIFVVGSHPDGWVETVELERSLPMDEFLVAAVDIEDSVGAALDFRLVDLQPGQIWTIGKPNANVDTGAFEQQARESCADVE